MLYQWYLLCTPPQSMFVNPFWHVTFEERRIRGANTHIIGPELYLAYYSSYQWDFGLKLSLSLSLMDGIRSNCCRTAWLLTASTCTPASAPTPARLRQKQKGKQQYWSCVKRGGAWTFWTVTGSCLRFEQAIIPHLKEESLGYLLIT